MAGIAKPKPIDVFEDNIADAERLVALTRALLNTRARRMRRELRDTVGKALSYPRKSWPSLDCVESSDIFVVLKPNGAVIHKHFSEVELGRSSVKPSSPSPQPLSRTSLKGWLIQGAA